MAEQTFTIHINKGEADSDFFRVDCKRVETCKKYLKSWYEQGKKWGNLYNCFYREGATYSDLAQELREIANKIDEGYKGGLGCYCGTSWGVDGEEEGEEEI